MTETPGPAIGRVVHYVSRTGNYTLPAMVNCTLDSIYQPGVDAGHLPPITDAYHAHLTVFSPGRPGMRVTGSELKDVEGQFLAPSKYPISENVAGTYQEWDIGFDRAGAAGTWHWPEVDGKCAG